jgi:cysteinyl-tRNA synthetase
MRIYDSLSETKKELVRDKKRLNLFVCGITPYDYSHIGHARTYIAFDAIVRYLRVKGWDVFYLQNVTDVDDKIIEHSKKEGTGWKKLARKFESAYHKNEKELGISSVSKYARATDHISRIISQIRVLIDKGCAYKIEGEGYYFDVSRFADYGKLSKRTAQAAEDGISRIDESVNKKNRADFCLWRFSKPGEPSWKSPFGEGRPGWHIEDTAITEKYFGPQYDVHGGAVDLKFPHHEAEIAQQESASGKKPMVKIWMHSGFLLAEGQKMSKSLGNFITINDFLKKHSPQTLRYLVLSHHYRSPIDYSESLAGQSKAALATIQNFIFKLSLTGSSGQVSKNILEKISLAKKRFDEAMEDDFNTPRALAEIFGLISSLENSIWELKNDEARAVQSLITDNLDILGIKIEKSPKIPLKIRWLARRREKARGNKQFIQADALRKEINELGYSVEDTPLGQLVQRIK